MEASLPNSAPPRPLAPAWLVFLAAACAIAAAGCRLTPLANRDWAPELSRMAGADFDGRWAHVHNVRNSNYRSDTDFDVRFEERTYDLTKLNSVDYILVPLSGMPRVAHTFVSFGFQGRDYLAISIEVPLPARAAVQSALQFHQRKRNHLHRRRRARSDPPAIEFPQRRCLCLSGQALGQSVPGPIRGYVRAGEQAFETARVLQHADEQLRNQPDRAFEPRVAGENSVQLRSALPRLVGQTCCSIAA